MPKGQRKSLEDVLEETRLSSRWSSYFQSFRDPYLHLTPEQYGELAKQNGFEVRRIRVGAKAWDFQSRSAFLAFGGVTFVEWTQHLPEADRLAFATEVLDRYQGWPAMLRGRKTSSVFTKWTSRSPPLIQRLAEAQFRGVNKVSQSSS